MKCVMAMVLLISVGAANASDDLAKGVIRLAATMNEAAVVCKHESIAEVQKAKEKQKAAAIADMQLDSAGYDSLYEAFVKEFQAKWLGLSKEQQSTMCAQLKNAPR